MQKVVNEKAKALTNARIGRRVGNEKQLTRIVRDKGTNEEISMPANETCRTVRLCINGGIELAALAAQQQPKKIPHIHKLISKSNKG